MSDRTKEIIIKTNTVITLVLLLLLVPGSFIYSWFLSERVYNIIFISILILSAVSGITLIILLPIFGLKQKPVKADRVPLPYNHYEDLKEYLQSALVKNQYKSHDIIPLNDQSSLQIFTRHKKMWELDCFVVIRIAELNQDILHSANDAITASLTGYYGKEQITDWINMITLVCVDRITPPFQKFVNSNMQQGIKNARLLAGISFGGKTLYIGKQKEGFAIAKYKKLRKEFLKIMNIPDRK